MTPSFRPRNLVIGVLVGTVLEASVKIPITWFRKEKSHKDGVLEEFVPSCESKSGKSKGGLSKRGLGPKGANWAKKGPFGAISLLPPWRWGAEESVPIGPEKAPIGPEKDPISPEKAGFPRKDFPPIFSENLGLKPPFVSPPLDFPK